MDPFPWLEVRVFRVIFSVEALGSSVPSFKVRSSGNIWPASSPGLPGWVGPLPLHGPDALNDADLPVCWVSPGLRVRSRDDMKQRYMQYSAGMGPAHRGGHESLPPSSVFCGIAYQSCPEDIDMSPFHQVPQCIASSQEVDSKLLKAPALVWGQEAQRIPPTVYRGPQPWRSPALVASPDLLSLGLLQPRGELL